MNDQIINDLSEAVRLNPEDARVYLNRGYAYFQKGNYDKAIEDFDSVVRLCPNYETDSIDSNFAHGSWAAVEAAIQLLNSEINAPFECAADFYYAGVKALFRNDKITASKCFEVVLELGYEQRAKVEQHLGNLKKTEIGIAK